MSRRTEPYRPAYSRRAIKTYGPELYGSRETSCREIDLVPQIKLRMKLAPGGILSPSFPSGAPPLPKRLPTNDGIKFPRRRIERSRSQSGKFIHSCRNAFGYQRNAPTQTG